MANNISSVEQTLLANAEWAHIAPGKVVVATNERAWVYEPRSADDRFAKAMEGSGSPTTTREIARYGDRCCKTYGEV